MFPYSLFISRIGHFLVTLLFYPVAWPLFRLVFFIFSFVPLYGFSHIPSPAFVSIYFLLKYILHFMCMSVCLNICTYISCMQDSKEPIESVRSPGTRVWGKEPLCECMGTKPDSSKQAVDDISWWISSPNLSFTFLLKAILTSVRKSLKRVLICIILMTKGTEYLK